MPDNGIGFLFTCCAIAIGIVKRRSGGCKPPRTYASRRNLCAGAVNGQPAPLSGLPPYPRSTAPFPDTVDAGRDFFQNKAHSHLTVSLSTV